MYRCILCHCRAVVCAFHSSLDVFVVWQCAKPINPTLAYEGFMGLFWVFHPGLSRFFMVVENTELLMVGLPLLHVPEFQASQHG